MKRRREDLQASDDDSLPSCRRCRLSPVTSTISSGTSVSALSLSSSVFTSSCNECTKDVNDDSNTSSSPSIFCMMPLEVLERVMSFLCVKDRLRFYRARRALSSPVVWSSLRLIDRRPDHLVAASHNPGDLRTNDLSYRERNELLTFFPPVRCTNCRSDANPAAAPLKRLTLYAMRKHGFGVPFHVVLSTLIARDGCSAIRSFSFGIEDVWQTDHYPLKRAETDLDLVGQILEKLGDECRRVDIVKWPRLQDDTLIDNTYSEMQAHYHNAEFSATDPVLAILANPSLSEHVRTLSNFWFDFKDPEFWAISRSEWCTTSHQWVWSEEEFASGHSLYPTQANREFKLVDSFQDLRQLRITLCGYSDDRRFLDPALTHLGLRGCLEKVQIGLRSSFYFWGALDSCAQDPGEYWDHLVEALPELRVTLTFIEYYNYQPRELNIFRPGIPVEAVEWLPGAIVHPQALQKISDAFSPTLVRLEIHCNVGVVIPERENEIRKVTGTEVLADVLKVLRTCPNLSDLIYDSFITLHFVKVVARLKARHWRRLVFFEDKIIDGKVSDDNNNDNGYLNRNINDGNNNLGCRNGRNRYNGFRHVIQSLVNTKDERLSDQILSFERGLSRYLGRLWRFHNDVDRNKGPRFYEG